MIFSVCDICKGTEQNEKRKEGMDDEVPQRFRDITR